jgi:hypothetical protein
MTFRQQMSLRLLLLAAQWLTDEPAIAAEIKAIATSIAVSHIGVKLDS